MDASEILKFDRMHILHSWSVNESLNPIVITDVDGVYFTDSDGRRFLDFSSQLKCVSVGHKNKKIIKVKNKNTKAPLVPYNAAGQAARIAKEISDRLMSKGLYTLVRWMFLSIAPPLSIKEDELRQGLKIIDDVLDFVDTLTDK